MIESSSRELLGPAQVAGGGLKVLRQPRLDRFGRFFLLAAEIFKIRLAIAAADLLQMEVDVLRVLGIERAQQITAELFARGARQPLPPPDFADAMHPRVAAGVDRRKL